MASYHSTVERQREFFNSGASCRLEHRREQLKTLKKLIEEKHETLTDAVYKDLRRLPHTTYVLEVSSTLVEIDYMLSNLERWTSPAYVEKTFLTALDTPMIVKEPFGVVLIIAPWNYPISTLLLPLVPAIAAGNTVIVKPSELAANTASAFAKLFAEYFNPEFLTVVQGGVPETTALLAERFDYILYTGSPTVGRIVMTAAAKNLTPVTLELGGKCPVIVEADADVELSAKRIAWGKWTNCGQTCVAPDYILTTEAVKPKLVEGIRNAILEFYGSDVRSSADYSRIINERNFDRLSNLLEESTSQAVIKAGKLDRGDLFIPPIVLDAARDDIFMKEEIFGPILPIVTVSDFDEALKFIRSGEKPLAAYLFTRSKSNIKRFYTETSSGGITINDVVMHLTVDVLPFGGVGHSGMGRYRGKFGFDTFTHEKAVLHRGFFGESLIEARYPPMTDKKFKKLKSLTGGRKAIPRCLRIAAILLGIFVVFIIGVIVGVILQRFVFDF